MGRVVDIIVHMAASENRTHSYDALGRLSTASGPWGAGSYTYDLLNNIRSKTLGPDTVQIEYNTANQISRARDTRDPESSSGQALISGAPICMMRAGM
jgi:hypothetical protein